MIQIDVSNLGISLNQIEAYLDDVGIIYRVTDNTIHISKTDLSRLDRMLAGEHFFEAECKKRQISGKRKKELYEQCEEGNLFQLSVPAMLLGKTILTDEGYSFVAKYSARQKAHQTTLAASTIKSKLDLSQLQVEALSERMGVEGSGRLDPENVQKAIEADKDYVDLETLINIIKKDFGIVGTKAFWIKFVGKAEAAKWFKIPVKSESDYVGVIKRSDKYRIFFDPGNLPRREIEREINKLAKYLSPLDEEYLWDHLLPEETHLLEWILAATPHGANNALQPHLHNILVEFAKENECVTDWSNGTIAAVLQDTPNISKRYFRNFLREIAERKSVNYNPNLIVFRGNGGKRDNQPYTMEVYLEFGTLIFKRSNFWEGGVVDAALENSACARALFKVSLCFGSAWRCPDLYQIKCDHIDNLYQLIQAIRDRKIDEQVFAKIWDKIQTKRYIANKTKAEIQLFMARDFYPIMGVIAVICEYHRVAEKRMTLFAHKGITVNTYVKLFGPQYEDLFGKKVISTKKLSKDYLLLQAAEASRDAMSLATLSSILAAYIRGHKIDLNKGQKTIYHYIPHSSAGYSVEDVCVELFRIRSFGFYKAKVLEALKLDTPITDLRVQADLLSALDINPIEIEKQLEIILSVQNMAMLKDDKPVTYKKIKGALLRMDENANDQYVTCLFALFYGYRNPDCIGKRCRSEHGLCKCGIYAREYVYVLRDDVEQLLQREKDLEKMLSEENSRVDPAVVKNEIMRGRKTMDYLLKTIDDFVADIDDNEQLYHDLLSDLCNTEDKVMK